MAPVLPESLDTQRHLSVQAAAKEADVPLNTPVSQEWLEGKFSDAFGRKLAVRCGYAHGSDPVSLREIWMCLDSQMQPFDCPDNIYRNCNGQVVLPAISTALSDDVPHDALNPGDFVGPKHPSATSASDLLSTADPIHELVFGVSLNDQQ